LSKVMSGRTFEGLSLLKVMSGNVCGHSRHCRCSYIPGGGR
jgi:hypothetical protein